MVFLALGASGCGGGPENAPYGYDVRPLNATCVAPDRPPPGDLVALEPAFGALTFQAPVFALQAPDDASRWFVVEQTGRVKVFPNPPGGATPTDFVDLTDRSSFSGESGLLGMAFHPDWPSIPEAFFFYSTTLEGGRVSRISRIRSTDGGLTLDRDTELVLLRVPKPDARTNHNGGMIAFGQDGYLYISVGDGGEQGTPGSVRAQDPNNVLGKVLRIDVDVSPTALPPYAIPSDNPFASGGGLGEIYALGFRNPWRWSFDRVTGELWLGDVGYVTREEISLVEIGGNYGWGFREGTVAGPACTTGTCESPAYIEPVIDYPRSVGPTVTGGYVYRGAEIPDLVGSYVFGDYNAQTIWRVVYDASDVAMMEELVPSAGSVASFAEDVNGELYAIDVVSGVISKIVPGGAPVGDTFPTLLSETGCVDPANPREPAAGLIPYDLNAPFWSDGLDKTRFVAVPDGEVIAVDADGDFDFPIGTVLVKSFFYRGRRIETRLLMRHPDGSWAGYTYQWNEAQTDATLLRGGRVIDLGGGMTWLLPGRGQCLACHTTVAGHTLGLEIAQLNRSFVYEETNRRSNQLATFEHIGLFAAPLGAEPEALPALADPYRSGNVEARARAFLHTNCAQCHQPGGTGGGSMDMHYTTALADMGLCDATPERGDLGVANARLVAPGDPGRSIVSVRIHALDFTRMPPLATTVVDEEGADLVDDWIRSLTACP